MTREPPQRIGSDHAVAVDERDERRAGRGKSAVASRGRTAIEIASNQPSTVTMGNIRDVVAVARAIVDNRHRETGQRDKATVELGEPVACGHDHVEVDIGGRWHRMRQARLEQPPGKKPVTFVAHRHPGQQVVRDGRTGGSEPEQPQWRSAPDHVSSGASVPVPHQPEAHRHRRHTDSPPSTAMTVPVMPLLSGPASHAMAAATSSGSSRRPIGCWPANSAMSIP